MLIEQVDLLHLVGRSVQLKRTAATKGGEFHAPCPFCGGRDRFIVWPAHPSGRGRFMCRGCKAGGDAVDYLRKREGISYAEALQRLGVDPVSTVQEREQDEPMPAASSFTEPVHPPSEAWQLKGWDFIGWAQGQLWSDAGADVLAYLRGRGFSDDTIGKRMLGWNPKRLSDKAERWGFSDAEPVHLAAGVVIPNWSERSANPGPWLETLWGIRIRRLEAGADPKYLSVRGSTPALYLADAIRPDGVVVMVEGELDALSIWQDGIAAVATGSTSWCRRARWLGLLARAKRVIVAYDADEAGQSAASWWLDALGAKAKAWRPWWGDPNDLGKAGAVQAWLAPALMDEHSSCPLLLEGQT